MTKTMATVFGVILLALGILGFIPGITTGSVSDGMLFGIFHVNALHDIIYLVSGAIAVWAGMTSVAYSKTYLQIFGVIYAFLAIFGFIQGDSAVLGIANNMADAYLHVVIAALALYFGFASSEAAAGTEM